MYRVVIYRRQDGSRKKKPRKRLVCDKSVCNLKQAVELVEDYKRMYGDPVDARITYLE